MGIYYMLVCDKCREFVYLGKMHVCGGVDGEFLVREELDKIEKYMRVVEELDASWTVAPPPIIYEFLKRHKACRVLRQIPDYNDEFYEVENDPNYKWLVWAYDYYKQEFSLMEKWEAVESKILLLWNEYSALYPSLGSVVNAVVKDSDLHVCTSEGRKVVDVCMRLLYDGKLAGGFRRRGLTVDDYNIAPVLYNELLDGVSR